MTDRDAMQEKLTELLAAAGFDAKYYSFYAAQQAKHQGKGMSDANRSTFAAVLESTGLSFKYHAGEKFFEHTDPESSPPARLKIAFSTTRVELILGVKTAHGFVGGPFSVLAAAVGKSRDPSFSHTPPYPKLPFSNENELKEAVDFGVSLYGDVKARVARHDVWGA